MPVQHKQPDDTSTNAFQLHALAHLHTQLGTLAVAAVALRFGFLYSHEDIAHVLNLSPAQVAQLLKVSLRMCRR
jgi:DNA-directed RNA polymerase specialized sigma24 family protein